ncbi:MAG: nicotinate-nucleotide adenylyltransferase [Porticoccus sp.]|jgi:nicotinate-nucleotide adenylyltransferase|uniref:nicotinate-nucleotide adenylyltransferase n=1 Tax=Porticoccus sp. Uisw_050_02 TaxID=3230978 RepID=UPI0030AE91BE|tara:strand:- start:6389 stop:7060 length:672 start_codon:yes stop_codon:yes gene_type:complete
MPLRPHGIGLFGGTFDPIHVGHLRTALELKQAFNLEEMRMIPSAWPPHRLTPFGSVNHRLKMLQLALSEQVEQGLIADDIELGRSGPSYTLDTLSEIRARVGIEASICLCLGIDSFADINTWDKWRSLLDIAHIVVAKRPGWGEPKNQEVLEFMKKWRATSIKQFHEAPAGKIFIMKTTPLRISSTEIRSALLKKEPTSCLLPDTVANYIKENELYQKTRDIL